ncbi:hypothetical protein ACWEIM_33340 [Streptomyces sp. NPDC004778]
MDRTPAGPGPAADVAATVDPIQAAEQTAVIEAVRLYVQNIRPTDLTDAGRLVGHLMNAEVLLMNVADAFADRTDTED